ncbi:MAG: aspartate 1-decarboxylase [Nitrospira sp.]|nr:aspartate 1-decarboxylase [Nitrospira sp.]MDD9859812.1 aspartate 1-decarboxylase [Nitrospira sp.]
MVLNGPTARKGVIGDRVIIFCYHYYEEDEVKRHRPTVLQVDERNRILPCAT